MVLFCLTMTKAVGSLAFASQNPSVRMETHVDDIRLGNNEHLITPLNAKD